jgi:hypothetical protein
MTARDRSLWSYAALLWAIAFALMTLGILFWPLLILSTYLWLGPKTKWPKVKDEEEKKDDRL